MNSIKQNFRTVGALFLVAFLTATTLVPAQEVQAAQGLQCGRVWLQVPPLDIPLALDNTTTFALIDLPAGATMSLQFEHENSGPEGLLGETGNWNGTFAIHSIAENGAPFERLVSRNWLSPGYYWAGEETIWQQWQQYTNTSGEDQTYLIELSLINQGISVGPREGLSYFDTVSVTSSDGLPIQRCLKPVAPPLIPPLQDCAGVSLSIGGDDSDPRDSAEILVPPGQRLVFDFVHAKNANLPFNAYRRGDWNGDVVLSTMNADGTRGQEVDSAAWASSGFYWSRQQYFEYQEIFVRNDSGQHEMILELILTRPGLAENQRLRTTAVNFRLMDDDGNETPVCIEKRRAEANYYAFGDSFSSGFGVGPYEPGTNEDAGPNDCQRSTRAYPHAVAAHFDLELNFHACQGGVVGDFYNSRDAAWGELPQLEYLTIDGADVAALVTLSVGGNDAGFGPIYKACFLGVFRFSTCHDEQDPAVTEAFDRLSGTTMDGIDISYDRLLSEIVELSGSAERVIVGYPPFFSESPDRNYCEGILASDQEWIARRTKELNDIIEDAAGRHGFLFADTEAAFVGHELCSADPWFLPLLDSGAIHPTVTGQQAMAQAVINALDGVGFRDQVGPGETLVYNPLVEDLDNLFSFSSSWSGSDVVMTLTSPSGRVIGRDTIAADVVHEVGPTHERYAISDPEPGQWTVELYGDDVPAVGEPVTFRSHGSRAANERPVAVIDIDRTDDDVTMSAGASSDQDGELVSWQWRVTTLTETIVLDGIEATHPLGKYQDAAISLVVRDDQDGFGFTSETSVGAECDPDEVDVPYNGIDENCDGADLTDADGDGSPSTAATGGTPDCDDTNDAINPTATDVPANGIDENCDGSDGESSSECQGEMVTIDLNLNGGTVTGSPGDDVILGTPGDDVINASSGDDLICGNGGNDILNGDAGDDTIWGGPGVDTINGGLGFDRVSGFAGADVINGGDDIDYLWGNDGDDRLNGDAGDDVIRGGLGDDTIMGGSGFDNLDGQDGGDTIWGGDNADEIEGGPGDDFLYGQNGWDRISASAGDDTIEGGQGNDWVWAGPGDDSLDGGPGDDLLLGFDDEDSIVAGGGRDKMNGMNGNDTIDAGDGSDQIWGGLGDDNVFAGSGFDWIWGFWGNDTINGGHGNDSIFGEGNADIINGGPGNDLIDGGFGSDQLNGNNGNDTINGGGLNDIINGNNGDDTIDGGFGNDIINGGPDTDSCIGGIGIDTTINCEPGAP